VPTSSSYSIRLRTIELLQYAPLVFSKHYFSLRHVPFAGAGTGMGTTTTCQNRMATFLGKKYATHSREFFCYHLCADFLFDSRLFQPGKPRKSEGWEKIYVASFGAGTFFSFWIVDFHSLFFICFILFLFYFAVYFFAFCIFDLVSP
jgi:hypothetical protein